jgi:hypothetical protein
MHDNSCSMRAAKKEKVWTKGGGHEGGYREGWGLGAGTSEGVMGRMDVKKKT